jgi:hypothetical protein
MTHAPKGHPAFCGKADEPTALSPNAVTCPACKGFLDQFATLKVDSLEEGAMLLALLEAIGLPMDKVQIGAVSRKTGEVRMLGSAAEIRDHIEAEENARPLPKPLAFVHREPRKDN